MTIVETTGSVTAGVDTHADVHVAAVVDHLGGVLGIEAFDTTEAGYHRLIGWLRSHGRVELVGVEGTGSYGAGLTRQLDRAGIAVVEVDRPNRQVRHRDGKSDPLDAVTAARTAVQTPRRLASLGCVASASTGRKPPVTRPEPARLPSPSGTRSSTASRRRSPWR